MHSSLVFTIPHVLQPLDVCVCSSFKSHVGLALNALIRSSEGHIPTTENIPKIVAEAWPKSVTPVNLMSGFRKTGIHPLNPGCIAGYFRGVLIFIIFVTSPGVTKFYTHEVFHLRYKLLVLLLR